MTTMAFVSTSPFFQVPRTEVQTSEGPVELPILYQQTRNLNAFFLVDLGALRQVLARAGAEALQPACRWRGRALVAVACYAYQHTSIGPYNEIGVAVPVTRPGVTPAWHHWLQTLSDVDNPERELGYHVLHLPVDTAAACAAGRELWGLPKFITPIHYGRTASQVDIQLMDPDAPTDPDRAIMQLRGQLGRSVPGPLLSPLLYSWHQGHWLKTAVHVRGGGRVHWGSTLELRVGHSAHPMADTLRALGLDGAHPLVVLDTDRFQSRLNAGRPLD